MDEFAAAHPEEEGGEGHEDAGDAEGPVGAMPFENPRDGEIGDDGAEVDREIEDIKDAGEEVLVLGSELVSDVGGDAGLDPACADGNHAKSGKKPALDDSADTHEGEGEVAQAVDDGEGDDGPVFAKEGIGDEGTEKGGEVDRAVKIGNVGGGLAFAEVFAAEDGKVVREEDGEGGLHSIEGEAFGGFVRDDVGDALWHAGGLGGGGAVAQGLMGWGLEEGFGGDEKVKVILSGDVIVEVALIDEGTANGSTFWGGEAFDFFGDFGDDFGADVFLSLDLDDVEGGFGADEEVDLAALAALGLSLEIRAGIEHGDFVELESGVDGAEAVQDHGLELQAHDGVPGGEGFEGAALVDLFFNAGAVWLDVFQVETQVAVGKAIADGAWEVFSGGGIEADVASDEASLL